MKNIVILISGKGTNLKAILEARKNQQWQANIAQVISSKPNVEGVEIAHAFGIPVVIFNPLDYPDRTSYDAALAKHLYAIAPDLVLLAGFMRILSRELVQHFTGRMINIHPSLLPSFPGLNTHQAALKTGVKWHGATVHFVTAELDVGPIIAQGIVPVHPTDDITTLSDRVHQIEHIIYPQVIEWFLKGQIILKNGIVSLNPPQSQFFMLGLEI